MRTDSQLVHNARVVRTGGVSVATSPDEMIAQVAAYLADPAKDHAGRRAIVEAEAGPFRGSAGRAIGDHLLSLVGRA